MSGSFGRERRIRKRPEFARAQKGGHRISSSHFTAWLFTRGDALPARLGLIVSRRVGPAVVRNRIKRLCREWFRNAGLARGTDWVLSARAAPDVLSFADVARELESLARRGRAHAESESQRLAPGASPSQSPSRRSS